MLQNVLSYRTSLNNLHEDVNKDTLISQVDEVLSGSDDSNRIRESQFKSIERDKRTERGHLQILNNNLNNQKVVKNYNINDVFNPNKKDVSNSTKNLYANNDRENLILSSTSHVNIGDIKP